MVDIRILRILQNDCLLRILTTALPTATPAAVDAMLAKSPGCLGCCIMGAGGGGGARCAGNVDRGAGAGRLKHRSKF